MVTYLDNQPLSAGTLPAQPTVAHVIESARANLAGTGRMLIGVRCNGEEISAERLEAIIGEPVVRFSRIDLISEEPGPVVLEILRNARSLFGQTFELLRQAAHLLASGNAGEAMETLVTCVQTWSQTHEAVVKGGTLLGVQFDTLEIQGRTVNDWLAGLVKSLRDLRDAIEARDSVLLQDMLTYELDETLQGWEAFLDGFIERIQALSLDMPS